MRSFLAAWSCCIAVLFSCADGTKESSSKPDGANRTRFNQSVDAALNAYYDLSESLVKWDSSLVSDKSISFTNKLQAIPLSELTQTVGNDSAVALTIRDAWNTTITASKEVSEARGLESKRRSFHAMTGHLYDLLRVIKYDGRPLFLQSCPMAFNDEEEGVWLTDKGKDSIRNPYLGLYHPKYGKGMLACGDNKSVIDFSRSK